MQTPPLCKVPPFFQTRWNLSTAWTLLATQPLPASPKPYPRLFLWCGSGETCLLAEFTKLCHHWPHSPKHVLTTYYVLGTVLNIEITPWMKPRFWLDSPHSFQSNWSSIHIFFNIIVKNIFQILSLLSITTTLMTPLSFWYRVPMFVA